MALSILPTEKKGNAGELMPSSRCKPFVVKQIDGELKGVADKRSAEDAFRLERGRSMDLERGRSEQRARRYRFGVFEVDPAAGEVWRQGLRVRMHRQPFEVLCLLLERPGEVITREEIARLLWAEGTFVDFEHGVNAAMGRLREALRDRASAPRFIETLPRRGYRFLGPVEVIEAEPARGGAKASGLEASEELAPRPFMPARADVGETWPVSAAAGFDEERNNLAGGPWLTTPETLPRLAGQRARVLFLLLQGMFLLFYVAELANLAEVQELLGVLAQGQALFVAVTAVAACCIPLRLYLLGLAGLQPPLARARFLRVWPLVLVVDLVGALSPLLLLHHISFGLALAGVCPLVYAPFAERSLVLMGAVGEQTPG